MRFVVPRIYPILDSAYVPEEDREGFLTRLGSSMAGAGLQMLEYRNKNATDAQVLADARLLRIAMPSVTLIMDDRVDVALAAGRLRTRASMGTSRLMGTSAFLAVSLFSVHRPVNG